eukprot:COSAG05_NODE_79_length_21178_cov_133.299492_8_plen_58_part_00
MVEDVDTIGTLTDNVQQKDKDEEDKEDVDTEEASSLVQTHAANLLFGGASKLNTVLR